MVSIVIVSHSCELAKATAELAREVTQNNCTIISAGGTNDPDHPVGTDPARIMKAIETAYDKSGVLVLMDLGSSLLSTETALEQLTTIDKSNIRLSSAPLVEGAIAAASAAATGQSLDEVDREARLALAPKKIHFDSTETLFSPKDHPSSTTAKYEVQWILNSPNGLHIRSAARLVKVLTGFNSRAVLLKGQQSANAHSITSLTKLGVRCGDTIRLIVDGPEAHQAANAFCQLAKQSFGENILDKTQKIP